jgi:hypothetical protein
LYQIELKIKTRPDNPGASTLINTNITWAKIKNLRLKMPAAF